MPQVLSLIKTAAEQMVNFPLYAPARAMKRAMECSIRDAPAMQKRRSSGAPRCISRRTKTNTISDDMRPLVRIQTAGEIESGASNAERTATFNKTD